MKYFSDELLSFLKNRPGQRNLKLVSRFVIVLFSMVACYSVLFHIVMGWEGQEFSWFTGVYWTFTVMSTLGFGDITFNTDLGRVFSVIVLLSGMVWLLIMMPFVFIEFFYQPWMKAQLASRTPRELPEQTSDHVVITHYDAVTVSLIKQLEEHNYGYVLIEPDLDKALRYHDLGFKVVVGATNDPETYQKVRINNAALLVTTSDDRINTHIAFTVREMNKTIPIVATAKDDESVDILKLAGCSRVLQLGKMMGSALARRMLGGDALAHLVGKFDNLLIAEALCAGTPLVGKTLKETNLRKNVGVCVVGVWERGEFKAPDVEMVITEKTVLVLAGSKEQLNRYDELFCIYHVATDPVLIIGGGRVGRATGRALAKRKIDYRIIEELPERIQDPEKYILGSASDLEVLTKAGIEKTPAIIITPRDDDTNVYLSIYCRRLRADAQIISRATYERNISTLHRAGTDFVMSYSSMGANMVFNLLKRSDVLMLAEGLILFEISVPKALLGKNVSDMEVRTKTGCHLVAIMDGEDMDINPDPKTTLEKEMKIIFIGSVEAEHLFLQIFGT